MLFEMQTLRLRPRGGPEALRRLEPACAARSRHGRLGGAWYSEIGPLNEVVLIWPYADLAERTRVLNALANEPAWPPVLDDLLAGQETALFTPLPGPPMLQPSRPGPLYELRDYRVRPGGGLARYTIGWEQVLERRLALSPLAVAMASEAGPLNRIVQLWPYESHAQRSEVRRVAYETGVLPPPGALDALVTQRCAILLPAPFSPMQ